MMKFQNLCSRLSLGGLSLRGVRVMVSPLQPRRYLLSNFQSQDMQKAYVSTRKREILVVRGRAYNRVNDVRFAISNGILLPRNP